METINDFYIGNISVDLPGLDLLNELEAVKSIDIFNISDLAKDFYTKNNYIVSTNDLFGKKIRNSVHFNTFAVKENNYTKEYNLICSNQSIIPVLNYDNINEKYKNIIRYNNINGYNVIEYGEFPQTKVSNIGLYDDNGKFNSELYEETGKKYSLPLASSNNIDNLLLEVFEFINKKTKEKFIAINREELPFCFDPSKIDYYKVEPIKWIVFHYKGKKIMVAEKALMSGIPYSNEGYILNFEESDIYEYLNEYLSIDMIPSNPIIKRNNEELIENKENQKKVSGKEFIKNYKVDVSVLEFVEKMPILIESKKAKGVKAIEKRGKDLLSLLNKKSFRDDTVKVRIDYADGFDPDVVSEYGNNMLHMCAKNGHTNTFIMLAATGLFDINKQNNYGTTALMTAAKNGHFAIVKACIELGADVNIRCSDGDTAIMSAKRHNHQEIFDYLLEHGAHVNYTNDNLETLQTIPSDIEFTDTYRTDEKKNINPKDLLEQARRELELIKNGLTVEEKKQEVSSETNKVKRKIPRTRLVREMDRNRFGSYYEE